MSQEKRFGLNKPNSTARSRTNSSHIQHIRRQIQPNFRNSLDGIVISKNNDVTKQIIQKTTRDTRSEITKSRIIQNIKPAMPRQSRSSVLARDVIKPKSKRQFRRHPRRHESHSRLLFVLAGLVFFSGALLGYIGWRFNQQDDVNDKVLSSSKINEKTKTTSEEDITPESQAEYKVASDMPRYLKVPKLDINARIKVLGDPPNGSLSAPLNVFDTGWYNHSSKPGEDGAILIDGYVHGPTKQAVFYRLGNIEIGDTIEIERGDGKLLAYSVVSIDYVDQDKVDMTKLLTPIDAKKPGLNLITCTDRYDIKSNKYEQRMIIYSVQQ